MAKSQRFDAYETPKEPVVEAPAPVPVEMPQQIPVAVPEGDACRAYATLARNIDNPVPIPDLLWACAAGLSFARGKTSTAPGRPTPWTALNYAAQPRQIGARMIDWGSVNWPQIISIIITVLQGISSHPVPADHSARAAAMLREV